MRLFLCLLALLTSIQVSAEEAAPVPGSATASWKGATLVVPLTGDLFTGAQERRDLERLVEEAEKAGAAALLFEVNVGGTAGLAEQEALLDFLSGVTLRRIAWVPTRATGPGALLVLACDSIYLSGRAIIGGGAATPLGEGEDAAKAAFQRDQSILRARARSLAKANGHRPDLAEALIEPGVEVKIGDTVVSAKGDLLTLTADEAARVFEGNPLLAKGIAASVEEVVKAEALAGEVVRVSPRGFVQDLNRSRLAREKEKAAPGGGDTGDEVAAAGPAEEGILFRRREEGSYRDKIVVLKVGEDTLATGRASFEFIDRTLKKAELDGAKALIFDMDTPGGFAWFTEGLVLNGLQNVSFPTYTFVNPRAESAGAIIAMGTDHIYMRPAATIGSALVVAGGGQDLGEAMQDKVTQALIGSVRNLAELKGHNPDIAEAFVTQEKEVRIAGVLFHEAGKVLNLNTVRATEVIGGRPVLAKGVARDLEDLVTQEQLEGERIVAEPLGMEAFAHWVQKLSVVLLVIGLAGAYLEMNTPGFGLPGFVSVIAFGVFFFGNNLAGNLAGYELAVLFVLGLVLIGVEIFLVPGTFIAGLLGASLVVSSLALSMVDRVDLQWKWSGLPSAESWMGLLEGSFYSLFAALAGALVAILIGMQLLPRTPMGRRFILADALPSGASIPTGGGAVPDESWRGWRGRATTDLRPSGKAVFEGRLLDVITEGEFVPRDRALRIVKREGSRIVVVPTDGETSSGGDSAGT